MQEAAQIFEIVSISEATVQKALEEVMQGRTTIVIAHRLSTILNMDRVYVLQQGKIIKHGSPSELLIQGKNIYDDIHSH